MAEGRGAGSIRPGGRTARVRQAVLSAFLDELVESGYAEVTFEGLAARAGVHKTTLYRRWGSREALLLDAALVTAEEAVPVPDTGALETDLRELAGSVAANLASPSAQAMLRAVVAEAATKPAVAEAVQQFWRVRFAATRVIVDRAVGRGEVAPRVDAVGVIEALVGRVYLRSLVTLDPIDEAFLDEHAALIAAAVVSGRSTGAVGGRTAPVSTASEAGKGREGRAPSR